MIMRGFVLLLLSLFAVAPPVQAHELDPGYVEIQPFAGGSWSVYWRRPDVQGKPMDLTLHLPDGCTPNEQPNPRDDGNGWSASWIVNCADGLIGGVINVAGLERQRTEVLVRIVDQDALVQTKVLTRDETSFAVAAQPTMLSVLGNYFKLGFEHILEGYDHLLFVFALMLLIANRWRLVGAITAFTVAHSITLGLSSLNFISVAGPPVEAVIALSIIFLAVEILRSIGAKDTKNGRNPWVICFLFGLLHGLGFAGALRDIGLPQQDIFGALLAFNVGVEAGQLVFVFASLIGFYILAQVGRLLGTFGQRFVWPVKVMSGYAIGVVATVWFVERVSGF